MSGCPFGFGHQSDVVDKADTLKSTSPSKAKEPGKCPFSVGSKGAKVLQIDVFSHGVSALTDSYHSILLSAGALPDTSTCCAGCHNWSR